MYKTLLPLLIIITYLDSSYANPPATKAEAIDTDYYGQKIDDPYRWLEDKENSLVREWFRAQNNYSRSILHKIPGRSALLARITALNDATVQIRDLQFGGEHSFYLKREAGENQFKLYKNNHSYSNERLLIDPRNFDRDGQPAAINYYHVSPNGQYVAYGIALGGAENSVLRVIDTTTRQPVIQPIERAELNNDEYRGFAWRPDSQAFFYNQLAVQGATPATYYQNSVARFHLIRPSSTDRDIALFSRQLQPEFGMTADDVPMITTSAVSSYAIGVIKHGDQNELTLYAAPLNALQKRPIPWQKLVDVEHGVTHFALRGNWLYLLTHHNAPRYRVVRMSLTEPRWEKVETVVEHSERVITGFGIAKNAIYVTQLDGGYARLLCLQFTVRSKAKCNEKSQSGKHAGIAKQLAIKLPFPGSIQELSTDSLQSGAVLRMASWNESPRYYKVNSKSGKVENLLLLPASKIDLSQIAVTRHTARGHDGVEVPLSILHLKNSDKNGAAPTLLSAYGAYGISQTPRYTPTLLAWLEKGSVFAVCHVRGGGEYGVEWHHSGQKRNKLNSIKDFIACAQHLITQNYTSPARLAGMGGSAGGIVVGGALVARPDLFAAMVSNVGMHDLLRAELAANGPPNIPEFGTVTTEDGFKSLYAVSSYHRIKQQTPYPAVLLTTGINDPRVDSWQPGKMAARLQAASNSGKPILLRVDYAGGHGGSSTKQQVNEELADRYAFLFWQLGVPEFQP